MAVVLGGLVPHPPLLVPEVGGPRVADVSDTTRAMRELCQEVKALAPERVVVITPHGPVQRGSMTCLGGQRLEGTLARFGSPQVRESWRVDGDFSWNLVALARQEGVPVDVLVDQELDHALFVPLYFLSRAGLDCPLTALSISGLSRQHHLKLGRAIARGAGRTVVLASGDLSHRLKHDGPYGFDPRGPEFDRAVVRGLDPLDASALAGLPEDLVDGAGVCGMRPLMVLLGALPGATGRVLSYQGPFGVGYAVARLEPGVDVVGLARDAVELWVRKGRELSLAGLPPELQAPCGTFVTLRTTGGALRGCIGTLAPTCPNRGQEIVRNAIGACARDPRFEPVRPDELASLTYSVYLLDPPEPTDETGLDPAVFGLIMRARGKHGVLLPGIEGIDTVPRQLAALRRKIGLSADEPVQLERFRVHVFGEPG